MPRNGLGVYSRPPGVDAVTNTTIESADWNLNLSDVEQDLNIPRPIVAGGTDANNATTARSNLQAERAMQTVTNFDSHVFETGSFYALGSATSAPVAGHGFVGSVTVQDANTIVVQARDLNDTVVPGRNYVRHKTAGVWGAWTLDQNGAFVLKAGDTMTGGLILPALVVNRPAGQHAAIYGNTAGVARWLMAVGDSSAETGANAGTDFSIYRYSDAGAFLGVGLSINRANGTITMGGPILVVGLTRALAGLSIQGVGFPTTGAGFEITYQSGVGHIQCYDRDAALFKPISIDGALTITGALSVNNSLSVTGVLTAMKGLVTPSDNNAIALVLGRYASSYPWSLYVADALSSGHEFRDFNDNVSMQIKNGVAAAQQVKIFGTQASGSPATGALVVTGGVGIGGAINVQGKATVNDGTASNSTATGALVVAGGGGFGGSVYSGSDVVAATVLRFGAGGGFVAGSIYSDANYGALFRVKTASPAILQFGLCDAAGNIMLEINAAGNALTLTRAAAQFNISAAASSNPSWRWLIGGSVFFTNFVDNTTGQWIILDGDATHGVVLGQNSSAWVAYSDGRMAVKKNARNVTGLAERLDHIRLIEYGEDHREIGVIAQEVEGFLPQIVTRGDDKKRVIKDVSEHGIWMVNPSAAAWAALQVCKELLVRIKKLEKAA